MAATRVAILGHTAQMGGAEIALLRLTQQLPQAWDVTVILFAHGELEVVLRQRGVKVEVLPLDPRTASRGRAGLTDPYTLFPLVIDSLAFAGKLSHFLTAMGTELVVANSLKSAVLGSIAARRARLPWVWHLHDRLSSDYLPSAVVFAMRRLARAADHVVANSLQTARLTTLEQGRVSVAYPGLPEDMFADSHQPSSPPVFGLLGRISSTKGQREFLRAAALVATAQPGAEFHVVGEALFNDQIYAEEVRALPARLGIEGRVRFTGWAADPVERLDQFTALVHASPVPEPFGQVIVEAMARRVPVIATLGGGVSEILTESAEPPTIPAEGVLRTAAGQLVGSSDPAGLASAMLWVLENPVKTSELAQNAADSALRRFSIKATADVCTTAWERVLLSAKPRSPLRSSR